MSIPPLSPQQRARALEQAASARLRRAEVREHLKAGRTGVAQVLEDAGSDDALARMRVRTFIESLPGVGPVTASRIMDELGIAASRRVRGLGRHQRTALQERFPRA